MQTFRRGMHVESSVLAIWEANRPQDKKFGTHVLRVICESDLRY